MPVLLNPKHERFCQEWISNGGKGSEAYIACGYENGPGVSASASRLLTHDKVAARIKELQDLRDKSINRTYEKQVAKPFKFDIVNRNARVGAYAEIADKIRTVIAERAADPIMQNVPGGKTGLLVHQIKGAGATKVDEFVVDGGLLREYRATMEQAAKELGQWSDKASIDIAWDGDLEKLTPPQLEKVMDQLAVRAFGQDTKLLEAAKAEAMRIVDAEVERPAAEEAAPPTE